MVFDSNPTKDWLDFEQFKKNYLKIPVEEYPNYVLEVIPEPVVSVHIITYQHADYIRDAVEGVLIQETDFPFEIIIGDDESTDGTREICIEYAKKNQDLIRLFLHKRENNIAIYEKPTHVFQYIYNTFNLRGKYVTICSGDDYWTDPKKLQKQHDYLERNKKIAISFTDYSVVDANSKIIKQDPLSYQEDTIFDTVSFLQIKKFPAPTTAMYRNRIFRKKIPKIILEDINEDKILFSILSRHGDVAYLHHKTAMYRKHNESLNSSKKYEIRIRALIETKKRMMRYFSNPQERNALKSTMKKDYINLFFLSLKPNSSESRLNISYELLKTEPVWLLDLYAKYFKYMFKRVIKSMQNKPISKS